MDTLLYMRNKCISLGYIQKMYTKQRVINKNIIHTKIYDAYLFKQKDRRKKREREKRLKGERKKNKEG